MSIPYLQFYVPVPVLCVPVKGEVNVDGLRSNKTSIIIAHTMTFSSSYTTLRKLLFKYPFRK